ncbi:hypothetical protein BCAH1134_C0024 (plasmid) [Bacillus cereus AH1134]|nr:hypothetical protein BCAH1134_C0024 [Bacillus cereus AH1134]
MKIFINSVVIMVIKLIITPYKRTNLYIPTRTRFVLFSFY